MKNPKLVHLGIVLLSTSALLLAIGFLKLYLNGKVLPRSYFLNENIGFTKQDELSKVLDKKSAELTQNRYRVSLDGAEKDFTLEELGITIDYNGTMRNMNVFHYDTDTAWTPLKNLLFGKKIYLKPNFNKDVLEKNIEEKFAFQEQKAGDARIAFDEAKKLIILPERQGKQINLEGLNEKVEAVLNADTEVLLLKSQDHSPLAASELEAYKDNLNSKLANTVRFEYENQHWNFKPYDRQEALELKKITYIKFPWLDQRLPIELSDPPANSSDYTVETLFEINFKDQIKDYFNDEMVKSIDRPMTTAKIYYGDEDKIIIEGTAENGQEIDQDQLEKILGLAVNKGVAKAIIPVKVLRASVETDERLAQQGVKELIGVGHTTFFNSPNNRIHNIGVGIKKFNGLLVKQGEEFSFNTNLGPVEAYTGYLPELVIKGKEGTIPEYGGGLCQVSSTAYRAALFAGLPIKERAPHSYAVSYYAQVLGYGLDATIYPGVRDFRFLNDTPGDIIIQSYAENGHSYFKFYGTADGRSVKMSGPFVSNNKPIPAAEIIETNTLAPGVKKQKENGHPGFDTTWFRYLTKDGKTIKETIFSNYHAMPPKVMVGSGAAPAASDDAAHTEFSS